MSKTEVLRALVTQRLTAAAEDILVLFERSIAEYEQEVLLLTQNINSQQQGPSVSSQPSLETTPEIAILSVRQDLVPIKEEPSEQLLEPTFVPVFLETKQEEDHVSLPHPIPTEESREENNGSDMEEEATPLSPQEPDGEGDSDSSESTVDSDDYGQEVPAKRRNTMSSSDDSCSSHSDETETSSSVHIPFSCLECGKTLHDKKKIEEHMKTHIGGPTYRCIICDESFCSIPALTRHKRKVHFVCQYCPKRFDKKSALKLHLIIHTKERKIKSFRCLKCGRKFTQQKMLIEHLKDHKKFEPFQCTLCKGTFSTARQRSNHMKLHKGNKRFACDVCHRNFKAQYNLTEHMKKHSEVRPFSCPACGQSFVEQLDLTLHLKLIHHICPVCSKGFQDKFALKSHLSDHTEAQLKVVMNPFSCPECGKRFSREGALQRHATVHSKDNRFKCNVCEKSFTDESTLERHQETHGLECPECGAKMELKSTVDLHLTRVHMICWVCKKRFTDRDRLKKHLQTHSGICPECGFLLKKTSFSLHLSRAHLMCPVCRKPFPEQEDLIEHLKVHIKEGTFDLSSTQIANCEDCGELFFLKSKLSAHMKETGHKGNFN